MPNFKSYICVLNIFNLKLIDTSDLLKLKHPVVTIGTFDGLHLGHQKVLAKTIEIANKKNGTPVVFTFWPHPRYVLGNGNFNLINTFEEKRILFKRLGVEYVYYQKFTKEFSNLTSQEYVKNILVDKIGLKTLVVGYDHQFGKNRDGKFDTLGELAKLYNFDLYKVDAFDISDITVSSTKIRLALENGEVSKANKLLGYDYFMSGTVVDGFKIGKTIGFPTANLKLDDDLKLIPKEGVYAAYIEIENSFYKGMLYIGYRLTIENQPYVKSIEVNIFDFSLEIYNTSIKVYLVEKLRGDIKFKDVNELICNLKIDEENSRKVLNEMPQMPISLI